MATEEPFRICSNHQMPVMYRGYACPWCTFIEEMEEAKELKYREGFRDGLEAASAQRGNDSEK